MKRKNRRTTRRPIASSKRLTPTQINRTFERLEDRRMLAVDLAQFAGFLPNALGQLEVQGVKEQIYKVNLPLIKDALYELVSQAGSGTNFLSEIQSTLTDPLATLGANPTQAEFLASFNTSLGDFNVNIVNISGNPLTDNAVEYQLSLSLNEANALSETIDLDASLGLSGLGIELNSNIAATLKLWFQLSVRFGVDNGEFYINTAASNDELKINAKVELANGSSLSGKIGFLQFNAATTGPTGIAVSYAANLVDPNGRLTSAEIGSGGIDFQSTLTMNADLKARFVVEFGNTPINPQLIANMVFNWDVTAGVPETSAITALGGTPTVNVDVSMGIQSGFVENTLRPFLRQIRQFTSPLEPIVEQLRSKPLKDSLGLDLTLFDMLQLPAEQKKFFDMAIQLVDLAKAADTSVDPLLSIQLGSFALNDVRQSTPAFAGTPSAATDVFNQLSGVLPGVTNVLNALNDGVASDEGLHFRFLENPTEIFKLFLGDPEVSLVTFKMSDLGYSDFKSKVLASFQVPPFGPTLRIDLVLEAGVDIKGNVSVGYDAKGLVDFINSGDVEDLFNGFYVDTTQPLLHISGLDKNLNATERLFTIAVEVNAGIGMSDMVEYLGVELPGWVQEALDVGVGISFFAQLKIGATLDGHLNANLRGDKPKFRLSELDLDECIFEVEGAASLGGFGTITAGASASIPFAEEVLGFFGDITGIEIKFKAVSVSWEEELFTLPPLSLFNFDYNCITGGGSALPPGVTDPKLAHLLPDGVLRLNVGQYVGDSDPSYRKVQTGEIHEIYTVTHVSGSPTDPGGETVRVYAFGFSQEFSGVKAIFADADLGNDQITIAPEVLSIIEIYGGEGNDTLKAGGGRALLDGGDGNDNLTGSSFNDELFGGDGNDRISAGAGDDFIIGGPGDDSIDGGIGRDTLSEEADVNWTLDGRKLTGTGTDTLTSIEVVNLIGGAGQNTFTVKKWNGEVNLAGRGGNDQYFIDVNGGGSSKYKITDTAGDDSVSVRGTSLRDDFTLTAGLVKEDSEEVSYTGIERLTVDAQAGQDRINVKEVTVATAITVLGGAESDIIRVSSNAGANDDGNMLGILGTLLIDAGTGGANRLIVSNFGGSTTQTIILKDDGDGYSSINGLTATAIRYKATGGSFLALTNGVVFQGFDLDNGVIVRGSNVDGERFLVRSSAANTTTKLEGNGGNDIFKIAEGDLNTLLGRINVSGGVGSDRIYVYDEGNTYLVDYLVTATALTSFNADDAPLSQPLRNFKGLGYDESNELLRLDCSDARNTIEVRPSLTTEFYIDGNLPASGEVCIEDGDFLKLDTTGTTGRRIWFSGRGNGEWSFTSGHKKVKFESIERFNHVDWVAVGADVASKGQSRPRVQVYDAETNELLFELTLAQTYGSKNKYGVSVAMGDVDGDGILDLVTAPGRNTAPDIKVFSGRTPIQTLGGRTPRDGWQLATIAAADTFGVNFNRGVNLAVGNVTGDCLADIVVSNALGAPTIRVFKSQLVGEDSVSIKRSHTIRPFETLKKYIGGATVAIGDFDGARNEWGSLQSEIVVGIGPGTAGQWAIYNAQQRTAQLIRAVKDPAGFTGGLNVAAGDVDGDGIAEVITGTGSGGGSLVRVFRADGRRLKTFRAFSDRAEIPKSNLHVMVRDSNSDGIAEVFAALGQDGRTNYQVKKFHALTGTLVDSFFAKSPDFYGGGINIG